MPGLFALFKGDSGSGKTVAALSFPNPVVLDHDRKMPSIANKHFPGKDVPYKQYENVLEAGETIEQWLSGGCPFDTIIADSVTSLSYTCLKTMDDFKGSNIMTKFREMRDNPKKSKGGDKMVELRGYDYYNAEDNFLKFYLDGLKMLWARPGRPHHVIVIAHVLTSESQDIKTKEITRMRRIVTAGKSIAAYIPAQFDETYHFAVSHGDILASDGDRVRHFCLTEAIGEDYAKTAYKIPYKIDFTNGSLYEKLAVAIEQGSRPETQTETKSKAANKLIL